MIRFLDVVHFAESEVQKKVTKNSLELLYYYAIWRNHWQAQHVVCRRAAVIVSPGIKQQLID